MAELINALPGIELPVGDVVNRLATMWESGPSSSSSPTEFRASQMNVVLHFGLDVTDEEARERFDSLIRFAQRYPSRIIVLCPSTTDTGGAMVSKLFSQCYIGASHREMCCCEALLLGYKSENFGHLANQVSIWLEGDLPTYHWFSGVPAQRIETYFDNLLLSVRRCIYDSNIEREDLSALNWPDPSRVHDLAKARLLPVRQAIGQFMSGYPIESLCMGLKAVTVKHCASTQGEAQRLLEWMQGCLADCDKYDDCGALKADFQIARIEQCEDISLSLELAYEDERFFKWRKFQSGSLGEIEASLGKHQEKILTQVKPLTPEQALAEALFF
jgi:glucose-6-phosphate dehydrogenase assembly protein OpcA